MAGNERKWLEVSEIVFFFMCIEKVLNRVKLVSWLIPYQDDNKKGVFGGQIQSIQKRRNHLQLKF